METLRSSTSVNVVALPFLVGALFAKRFVLAPAGNHRVEAQAMR